MDPLMKLRTRPELANAMEYSGAALGLTGAYLLAMNIALSPWGWVVFLLSNVAWIGCAISRRMHGLLAMQLGFTASSILGIVRAFNLTP